MISFKSFKKKITINKVPFLDMKLSWNLDDNFEFSVYRKEN